MIAEWTRTSKRHCEYLIIQYIIWLYQKHNLFEKIFVIFHCQTVKLVHNCSLLLKFIKTNYKDFFKHLVCWVIVPRSSDRLMLWRQDVPLNHQAVSKLHSITALEFTLLSQNHENHKSNPPRFCFAGSSVTMTVLWTGGSEYWCLFPDKGSIGYGPPTPPLPL
jgi:hypothetical protein